MPSAHKIQKRKHPSTARMNLWLLSGLILLGITAILTFFYIRQLAPPIPVLPFQFILTQQEAPYDRVIDVCSVAEYDAGHYSGAINIHFTNVTTELPKQVPNPSDSIIFYCDQSRRSYLAAQLARRLGYDNVSYIVGGNYKDMTNTSPILPF